MKDNYRKKNNMVGVVQLYFIPALAVEMVIAIETCLVPELNHVT